MELSEFRGQVSLLPKAAYIYTIKKSETEFETQFPQ